jgi:hypothetical protein
MEMEEHTVNSGQALNRFATPRLLIRRDGNRQIDLVLCNLVVNCC